MRRTVASYAVVLAGATAMAGPAIAEWSALSAVRQQIARCPGAAPTGAAPTGAELIEPKATLCGGVAQIDIDTDGLRLWHPWLERGGLRLEADRIAATPTSRGLVVDAESVRLGPTTRSEPPPSPPAPTSTRPPPADAAASPARPTPLETRGIPVQIRVHGPLSWSHGGMAVVLDEPTLHLDGHGRATAEFSVQLDGAGLHARSTERFTAHAVDGDPRAWRAEGTLRIAEGTAMRTALAITRDRVTAQWHDPEGGRLVIDAPGPLVRRRSTRSTRSTLHAESFAAASLGHLGRRTLAAWGIDPSAVVLDATVHASGLGTDDDAGPPRGEIEIEHLRVSGLVVEHPKLARAPVAFDPLELEGRLWWQGEHDQGAQLWIAHRGARVALDLQRSEDALDLRTELAPLPCQDLLDAFPAAMSEMVEGTRLRGRVGGQAELHVDRRALAAARDQADRRPDAPAPGTFDLSFPFLDRCTVEQDDPRLDLAALSGAYRHRVLDHHGHEQRRVMAPGAPGYVSLHEVPRLVRAFVTLEDRRFWRHDGFDREQMHNAFWHNVVRGRVSRGASTISQQAARNLWLGVDRSWGRKLQEALLTARLEATTDKRRIMELYLNVIELGPGTHGVDEAARLYFGKPAAALSVLQAVHLASLAPAPTRLSRRFVDGRVDAAWLDGLRAQVRRMARAGLITPAQRRQAHRDDLGLLDRRSIAATAPHEGHTR